MTRDEAKIIYDIIKRNDEESWQTLYKNQEYVKAWADGKDIWCKVEHNNYWEYGEFQLGFSNPKAKYRLTPLPEYRIALLSGVATMVSNREYTNRVEKDEDFQRWLTNWVQYDPSED